MTVNFDRPDSRNEKKNQQITDINITLKKNEKGKFILKNITNDLDIEFYNSKEKGFYSLENNMNIKWINSKLKKKHAHKRIIHYRKSICGTKECLTTYNKTVSS